MREDKYKEKKSNNPPRAHLPQQPWGPKPRRHPNDLYFFLSPRVACSLATKRIALYEARRGRRPISRSFPRTKLVQAADVFGFPHGEPARATGAYLAPTSPTMALVLTEKRGPPYPAICSDQLSQAGHRGGGPPGCAAAGLPSQWLCFIDNRTATIGLFVPAGSTRKGGAGGE